MFSRKLYKQIIGLPAWFAGSLGASESLPPAFLRGLGRTNLRGWKAYTVYDNFLDGSASAVCLPQATASLRRAVGFYCAVFAGSPGYLQLFHNIMDRMDRANSWEQACARINIADGKFSVPSRLPDFDNIRHLCDRSLGHALGPLAVLCRLKFKSGSCETAGTLSFFENYLAARQLGDDAHDWREDLSRGFINGASVRLLRLWGPRPVNLKRHGNLLNEIFWLKTLPKITKLIRGHLYNCRRIVSGLGIIKKPKRLLAMVEEIELAVMRAESRQKKIKRLF